MNLPRFHEPKRISGFNLCQLESIDGYVSWRTICFANAAESVSASQLVTLGCRLPTMSVHQTPPSTISA